MVIFSGLNLLIFIGYQLKGMLYSLDTVFELMDVWKKSPAEVDFAEVFEYLEDLGTSIIDHGSDLGFDLVDDDVLSVCSDQGLPRKRGRMEFESQFAQY